MLMPPVPCVSTLFATVPMSGLRARTIGSCAGFSAVPHPSHILAPSVAGAVTGTSIAVCLMPTAPRFIPPCTLSSAATVTPRLNPITSRSAPALLSIALDMFSDLGNPEP